MAQNNPTKKQSEQKENNPNYVIHSNNNITHEQKQNDIEQQQNVRHTRSHMVPTQSLNNNNHTNPLSFQSQKIAPPNNNYNHTQNIYTTTTTTSTTTTISITTIFYK